MAYVNVEFKEELASAKDKWLWVVSNKMLFNNSCTTKKLKIKSF